MDGVAGVLAEADEHPGPSFVVQDGLQVILVADPHVLVAAVRAVEHPGHVLLQGASCSFAALSGRGGGGGELGVVVSNKSLVEKTPRFALRIHLHTSNSKIKNQEEIKRRQRLR